MENNQRIKWTSTDRELPDDQEEVLIRTRDAYHLAVYYSKTRSFKLGWDEWIPAADTPVRWIRVSQETPEQATDAGTVIG